MKAYSAIDLPQKKSSPQMLWERKGLLGWWLTLTAPPRPADLSNLQVREYVRRSELISLVAVALACFALSLTSASLKDPAVLLNVIIIPIVSMIALVFNRFGKINVAAYILIVLPMLGVMIPSLELKNGYNLDWLTSLDVLSIPVFVSALIINRRASWFFAAVAIIFVFCYFTYFPHQLITAPGANHFDDVAYGISVHSAWGEICIPISLSLFAALFGTLAALSFESALIWGEQSRDEANRAMEIAIYKDEAEKTLGQFIQEITQSIVSLDSGRLSLLQERMLTDPLHNTVIFLNNQLKKIASLRAQHSKSMEFGRIWGELELLYLDLDLAFRSVDHGPLRLLHDRPLIQPLQQIVALMNSQLSRLDALLKQGSYQDMVEVRRLLDIFTRVRSQPALIHLLDSGMEHFSSRSLDVNHLAKEIYRLLALRHAGDWTQERTAYPGQIFPLPGDI